jgi:hypothetical protein
MKLEICISKQYGATITKLKSQINTANINFTGFSTLPTWDS